jgi:UDP-N-acetylglucosamine diphosphorylase/glucosamine-1-phosphate N-acetyltransferase
MNFILFDTEDRKKLFPLTVNKAVADLRIGILTIKERWEKLLDTSVFILTEDYLQPLYQTPPTGDVIFIDASAMPDAAMLQRIVNLADEEAVSDESGLVAARISIASLPSIHNVSSLFTKFSSAPAVRRLSFPFQIFQWNDEMIRFDFSLLTKGRLSGDTNETVHVTKSSQVFIEEGARLNYCNLNASEGPIYIGKNATVMEGCFIRGPFALCEGAVLKMGAKVYGATTVGPHSSGGGEIKNSVIMGYSNKAHDGYLGDSVIGEWCNVGAGTSNSNLKNTASAVNLWNYSFECFIEAGIKCGVVIGDYSRTAINSSINTGTVIGLCCNVFGHGLLPKFVRDFSWGEKSEQLYQFEKAIRDIGNWKKLKNKTITEQETQVLKHIFGLVETNNL